MVGLIEGRANEIVNRGIHDDEVLAAGALHILDAGDEDARAAGDEAAGISELLREEVRGGEMPGKEGKENGSTDRRLAKRDSILPHKPGRAQAVSGQSAGLKSRAD